MSKKTLKNFTGKTLNKIPLSSKLYATLALGLAIGGFVCMVMCYTGWGTLLFALSGLFSFFGWALNNVTFENSCLALFLIRLSERLIDFLLIFSFLWVPMYTPYFWKGRWVLLLLFLVLAPYYMLALGRSTKMINRDEGRYLRQSLGRGAMFTLLVLVPAITLSQPVWGGFALLVVLFLAFVTVVQVFINILLMHCQNSSE